MWALKSPSLRISLVIQGEKLGGGGGEDSTLEGAVKSDRGDTLHWGTGITTTTSGQGVKK